MGMLTMCASSLKVVSIKVYFSLVLDFELFTANRYFHFDLREQMQFESFRWFLLRDICRYISFKKIIMSLSNIVNLAINI